MLVAAFVILAVAVLLGSVLAVLHLQTEGRATPNVADRAAPRVNVRKKWGPLSRELSGNNPRPHFQKTAKASVVVV
jgi:hypothetical protein